MYWLPSASHTLEPSPRTINGDSHPTALKARTGEFTPPGINCSARCCRRLHLLSFRGMLLLADRENGNDGDSTRISVKTASGPGERRVAPAIGTYPDPITIAATASSAMYPKGQ